MNLEHLKIEILVFIGVVMGSVAALCRYENLSFKRICQELFLSWTASLICYCICKHYDFSEWMLVSICTVASYSGSKLLPFLEWLFKHTTIQVTEKRLGIDLDKDGHNQKKENED